MMAGTNFSTPAASRVDELAAWAGEYASWLRFDQWQSGQYPSKEQVDQIVAAFGRVDQIIGATIGTPDPKVFDAVRDFIVDCTLRGTPDYYMPLADRGDFQVLANGAELYARYPDAGPYLDQYDLVSMNPLPEARGLHTVVERIEWYSFQAAHGGVIEDRHGMFTSVRDAIDAVKSEVMASEPIRFENVDGLATSEGPLAAGDVFLGMFEDHTDALVYSNGEDAFPLSINAPDITTEPGEVVIADEDGEGTLAASLEDLGIIETSRPITTGGRSVRLGKVNTPSRARERGTERHVTVRREPAPKHETPPHTRRSSF
ncbi:hypothetical protein [Trueperella pyogenes]